MHIRAVPNLDAAVTRRHDTFAFECSVVLPEVGKEVLEGQLTPENADRTVGRVAKFGHPCGTHVSADGLAHQFVDAAIHLGKLLELTEGGRHGKEQAKNALCAEMLRILLIRDLEETYGPESSEYRLDQVHYAAANLIPNSLVRERLRRSLTSHLDDASTRTYLAGRFTSKYCGGDHPRLFVPGVKEEAYKRGVINECREALEWFSGKVGSPLTRAMGSATG